MAWASELIPRLSIHITGRRQMRIARRIVDQVALAVLRHRPVEVVKELQ